jgi:hypothetical protein
MKALHYLATATLVAGALAPEARADGRNPGSVLFYTVHRSGSTPAWFTIISVTNTATTPQTPSSFGGSTNVHFDYVNITPGTTAFLPSACTIFDRIEFLTPADTLSVLTNCHNAFTPVGQEGYVVISAEDPSQGPGGAWDHDYLIGSEVVLSASGVSYMLNAIPFEGLRGLHNSCAHPSGELRFDGTNYEQLPDILMADFIAIANSQLALINLTGGPLVENALLFSVWNDNERALSATLRFRCWFDQPLTAINPLFANNFLASIPNDPDELDINCDGFDDLETGWFKVDSVGCFWAGGQRYDDGNGPVYDGALLGSISAGPQSIDGGFLLWEVDKQNNGRFRTP